MIKYLHEHTLDERRKHMDKICGAYAEHWEELGKPKGWLGCSLPEGHSGFHSSVCVPDSKAPGCPVPAKEGAE